MALGQLSAYLQAHQQTQDPAMLTEAVVRECLTSLQEIPTATGTRRSSTTVATYARSVRAFGNWLVRTERRTQPLLSSEAVPKASSKHVSLVDFGDFARLLEACRYSSEPGAHIAASATARDQAILWLLWDGGLLVSEICALHMKDVLPSQGIVRIEGTGAKKRRLMLGSTSVKL